MLNKLRKRRLLAIFLIIGCFSLSSVFAASPALLTGLHIQSSSFSSQFTFILNKKVFGRVKFVSHPNRVLIELDNIQMDFDMKRTSLYKANVTAVDYKKLSPRSLQFIFSVKDKPHWKINYLLQDEISGVRLQVILQNSQTNLKTNTKKNTLKLRKLELQQQISKELAAALTKQKNWMRKKTLQSEITPAKNFSRSRFTIVIDAGHGGKDSGAIGVRGTTEKNIVLAIAKKLAYKINQSPHMRAILTRDGDYFVPLRDRLKFARKGEASLFIAIHADAYFDKSATGASVYALSQRGATSEAARWLAKRDNYSELDGIELDALKDRSSMLRSVLIDLSQTATIQDSIRLGNRVLDALNDISSLHYTQVEQAPFVVLKSPDIPSILVEVGFMTNPKEERRLSNPTYQQKIAQALLQGIDQYVKKYGLLRSNTQALSSLNFHSIVRDHLLYADDSHDFPNTQINASFS